MSNQFNTLKNAPGVVAKLAAEMFANKLQFCKTIDMADETDFEGKNGYSAGDTIYISKPARTVPGTNRDITSNIGDVEEEKVALTLDIERVDAVALTSNEFATDFAFKSWAKRILEPRVSAMAQFFEKDVIEKATDAVFHAVGTPGSTVLDTDTTLAMNQKITDFACPDYDNRRLLVSPAMMRSAVNADKGLFNSGQELSQEYIKGRKGTAHGFTWYESNLLNPHANGADVSFEVDTTVSTEGQSTLIVNGLTTSTTGIVKKGTVFTIDTVNAVNPITKEDLGHLQQFVVTADADSNGSGVATLNIYPAIYTSASDGLQTVTAFPVDGDTCNTVGAASTSYTQSLAYHKSAFRMATVPLIVPDGVEMAAQETVDGITVRVIRDYDILKDRLIMRLDILGGLAAIRPEWAVRLYP